MFLDAVGIIFSPKPYLKNLSSRNHSPYWGVMYSALMSLLPPIAFYWGTTVPGWSIGARTIRLAPDNAAWFALFFYLALLTATIIVGSLFSWISRAYTKSILIPKGIEAISLCATPIFLAGVAAIYPLLWLDILLVIAASWYSVYILYLTLNVHLELTEEQSFLYTCSALAFILVIVISIMGLSAMAWTYLTTPVFLG